MPKVFIIIFLHQSFQDHHLFCPEFFLLVFGRNQVLSHYVLYSAFIFFRHKPSVNQRRALVKHKINAASTPGEKRRRYGDVKLQLFGTRDAANAAPVKLKAASNKKTFYAAHYCFKGRLVAPNGGANICRYIGARRVDVIVAIKVVVLFHYFVK